MVGRKKQQRPLGVLARQPSQICLVRDSASNNINTITSDTNNNKGREELRKHLSLTSGLHTRMYKGVPACPWSYTEACLHEHIK